MSACLHPGSLASQCYHACAAASIIATFFSRIDVTAACCALLLLPPAAALSSIALIWPDSKVLRAALRDSACARRLPSSCTCSLSACCVLVLALSGKPTAAGVAALCSIASDAAGPTPREAPCSELRCKWPLHTIASPQATATACATRRTASSVADPYKQVHQACSNVGSTLVDIRKHTAARSVPAQQCE